jgi:hypothetical protein
MTAASFSAIVKCGSAFAARASSTVTALLVLAGIAALASQ